MSPNALQLLSASFGLAFSVLAFVALYHLGIWWLVLSVVLYGCSIGYDQARRRRVSNDMQESAERIGRRLEELETVLDERRRRQ